MWYSCETVLVAFLIILSLEIKRHALYQGQGQTDIVLSAVVNLPEEIHT